MNERGCQSELCRSEFMIFGRNLLIVLLVLVLVKGAFMYMYLN